MLANIFTNRLFIGALAFFVLCVAGSLLYMHHENQKGAEYAAETGERVRQWNKRQKEAPPAEVPVVEQPEQVRHFHPDGTFHTEPHENKGQESLLTESASALIPAVPPDGSGMGRKARRTSPLPSAR